MKCWSWSWRKVFCTSLAKSDPIQFFGKIAAGAPGKKSRKSFLKYVSLSWIPRTAFVTSALPISTKSGTNMLIRLLIIRFEAKYWKFSVNGSLLLKQHFCGFWVPSVLRGLQRRGHLETNLQLPLVSAGSDAVSSFVLCFVGRCSVFTRKLVAVRNDIWSLWRRSHKVLARSVYMGTTLWCAYHGRRTRCLVLLHT